MGCESGPQGLCRKRGDGDRAVEQGGGKGQPRGLPCLGGVTHIEGPQRVGGAEAVGDRAVHGGKGLRGGALCDPTLHLSGL